MTVRHVVMLVEEPSMEAFLDTLLPRLMPADRTYEVHAFQDKSDLLRKLPMRLRGYRHWFPDDWRLVVLVDRDADDCHELKERLENIAGGVRADHPFERGTWPLADSEPNSDRGA